MCTEVLNPKTGEVLNYYGVIHHYYLEFDFDKPALYEATSMDSWIWSCYNKRTITKKDAESVFYFCNIMLWTLYLAG